MRPKSLLLLVLALGCGLVASIGISQVMERRNQNAGTPQGESVPVFVALNDINTNDQITPEMVQLKDFRKQDVPEGAIHELDKLKGRRVAYKIFKGEPIVQKKLIGEGVMLSASQELPPGYRSIPVKVDASSGALLIKPGDRVDVQWYYNRNPSLGIQDTGVKTILQDIRVFATDQQYRRDGEGEEKAVVQTVSLMVTPDQAAQITLASRLGDIRLILRHPDDNANVADSGADLSDLLAGIVKGNRDKERESLQDDAKHGSGLSDFLNGLAGKAAQPTDHGTSHIPQPWKMLLIEGSDVHEVEFDDENRLPRAADGTSAGTYSPPFAIPASTPVANDAPPEPAPRPSGEDKASDHEENAE